MHYVLFVQKVARLCTLFHSRQLSPALSDIEGLFTTSLVRDVCNLIDYDNLFPNRAAIDLPRPTGPARHTYVIRLELDVDGLVLVSSRVLGFHSRRERNRRQPRPFPIAQIRNHPPFSASPLLPSLKKSLFAPRTCFRHCARIRRPTHFRL